MIELAHNEQGSVLLQTVLRRPEWFSSVLLCSPFIDEEHGRLLANLARACRAAGTGLTILTSPTVATWLRSLLDWPMAAQGRLVVSIEGLHAKCYVAVGRRGTESVGLITSSNLTSAGTTTNLELGVTFTSQTAQGAALVSRLADFFKTIMAQHHHRAVRTVPRRAQ